MSGGPGGPIPQGPRLAEDLVALTVVVFLVAVAAAPWLCLLAFRIKAVPDCAEADDWALKAMAQIAALVLGLLAARSMPGGGQGPRA